MDMSRTKYPHVFRPFTIRGVLFKNRVVQAPPGCFYSGDDNGYPTDDFVSYYRQYARGGVAICTVGNCTIDISESSDEPRQLQIQNPDCVQPLKYFAEMCQSYGVQGSLELTHNGKDTAYETIGRAPFSVSSFVTMAERIRAEKAGRELVPTEEMTREKIRETIAKYAKGALHAKQAGMKICMIHGAHGNLIAQFASPFFNKRTDEYGGSLENRARFACEVIDDVRAAVGEDFVLEYRISGDEYRPEHMRLEETLEFIKFIKDKVDILHVSGGLHDVHGEPYWMRYLMPNYMMDQMLNVRFAAAVKKAYPDIMVATVGAIKNIKQAEEIISSGKADIVAMNRALHADYEMPRKFAESREWEHMPCLRCRCFRLASPHTAKLCSVNPIWGRFKEYPGNELPRAATRKKVAVVGGGPGGVEAVKWLLQRGHDVTLYEKSDKVGGRIKDAVAAPFKQDLRDYLGYVEAFAENCGARVLLSTEATPEMLNAENYDAVIAAVGADPIMPQVPGADKPFVHWAPDAENGIVECGQNVVIAGGATLGTEASISLAMEGKNVTVIEMSEDIDLTGTGAGMDLMEKTEQHGIKRMLGWKLVEILDKGVIAENVNTGEKQEIPADTVLMAVGMKPRRGEALKFYNCCPPTSFFIIGDSSEPSDIRGAVFTAFEAARYI